MWWLRVVAVVGAVGCTTPNPRSCADGLCTDQAFPFCDVDGTLGGTQNECIAVACEPEEFAACRGDLAVTCNGVGNDFNLIECPLGCDNAVGCLACSTNAQCSNPTPICDAGTSCRGCIEDDECPSRVCDTGSCAAVSDIVYVANDGSAASDCSLAVPCTMVRAIELATASVPQPTIRMLPGVYVVGLAFSGPTTSPINVVATGATIADMTALSVLAGAEVKIRGPELVGTALALGCGEANTPFSRVTVLDAKLIAGNDSASVASGSECELVVSNSKLSVNDGGAITIARGARFTGDRLHIAGTQTFILMLFNDVHLTLTNSVIEDPVINFASSDTSPPGSSALFNFNTIVLTPQSGGISCSGLDAEFAARFENNIIVSNGNSTAVISGNECELRNNILHPQPGAPATNLDVDPMFVDAAAGNFRVQPTSAAVDTADSTLLLVPDHDFSGAVRPQGAGHDIGAFEQ